MMLVLNNTLVVCVDEVVDLGYEINSHGMTC